MICRRGGMYLVDGETVGVLKVGLNTTIQSFGNALAVFRLLQPLLIGSIGNKGDLRKYRGHMCPDQHNEWSFANSAAPVPVIRDFHSSCQRVLNGTGEIA